MYIEVSMLDWLGLTPVQTQVVGWLLIVVAVAMIATLFWLIITRGKHWKRFERNVKVISTCEEEIDNIKSQPTQKIQSKNSRKK